MTTTTKEDVLDMIRSGEISDAEVSEAIGGGTRVQKIADGCVLARIVATRANTHAANKSVRNNLARETSSDRTRTTVNNKLFAKGAVTPVSAPMHAARELLAVGKRENSLGHAANESGANFGLSKWDGTWTVVLRRRLPALQSAVTACADAQDAGKNELRAKWYALREQAKLALGDMFDSDLWPCFNDWCDRWSIKLEYIDFPSTDIRINMDDVARKDIAAQTKANTLRWVQEHLLSGWENFSAVFANTLTFTAAVLASDAETVQKMNGTTGTRKSKRKVPLSARLIENVRAQAQQAQAVGEVTQDTALTRIATEALAVTHGVEVENLKRNEQMRDSLAVNLGSLAERMEAAQENTAQGIEEAQRELTDALGEGADDLLGFA